MDKPTGYIPDRDDYLRAVADLLLETVGQIDEWGTDPDDGDERWFPSRAILVAERLDEDGERAVSSWVTDMPLSDQVGMLSVAKDHATVQCIGRSTGLVSDA